jgi:hypothetical protein
MYLGRVMLIWEMADVPAVGGVFDRATMPEIELGRPAGRLLCFCSILYVFFATEFVVSNLQLARD